MGDLLPLVHERDTETLTGIDERSVYDDATPFLAGEFDASVEVYAEDDETVEPAGTASRARPFRPAIHIE